MCIYFLKRTTKGKTYFYCKMKKQKVIFNDCSMCLQKKHKKISKIKKKTKKQIKIEGKRYSIITTNLDKCFLCDEKKADIHEAIGGCNRKKSMEWGLTIPICRKCHRELEDNQRIKRKIQQLAQKTFETKYNHDLFMQEFKKNYLN